MASLRLYDYMTGVEYVDMDAKHKAEHKHSQDIMVKVECWDQDSWGSLGSEQIRMWLIAREFVGGIHKTERPGIASDAYQR